MNFLQITSLTIVLAALFGAINYLFLRLPSAISILVVALAASFGIFALDLALPHLAMADEVRRVVTGIDFSDALLEGMLGLLLFAGALHVKLADLRAQWAPVLMMATMGVALSTVIVGSAFSLITGMPLLVALVFGALISPTDPVAVLGVLKAADLPKALETKIAGDQFEKGAALRGRVQQRPAHVRPADGTNHPGVTSARPHVDHVRTRRK